MLQIYNSLTRTEEPFQPLTPGHVKMYVCGMTVYDLCHLGHARVMVVFDMVASWLRTQGYEVTYVRNITDVDDKIIRRAKERNITTTELTEQYIQEMYHDAQALGVRRPTFEPKATEYIDSMIHMIQVLMDRGFAYQTENGDVMFSTTAFEGYGKLSHRDLDQLKTGDRNTHLDGKKSPEDFVLWKPTKPNEPIEVQWESPWGLGRPGWHIECSVMSTELLGERFDIHGGGADLEFPHHENEIAQSEAYLGHTQVNTWMHNGFIHVNDEKMAKSLNNFLTIREALIDYDPEVIRFFILRSHYRSGIDYSDARLQDAHNTLKKLYLTLQTVPAESPTIIDWDQPFAKRFQTAMNHDFDTPSAVTVLFELAHSVHKTHSETEAGLLKALAGTLGLLQQDPALALTQRSTEVDPEWVQDQIQQRTQAKLERDFHKADQIRNELLQRDILLEDQPQGTRWRRR